MNTYTVSDNPHIVVNSFIRSGIPGALDGQEETDSENESNLENQEDYTWWYKWWKWKSSYSVTLDTSHTVRRYEHCTIIWIKA